MSETQRNIAAVLDLLEEHDVLVKKTKHDHDYSREGALVDVELTIRVPSYDKIPLREEQ